MMTEEQANELGKRAMAAGWTWQPGALSLTVDAVTWRCIYQPTTESLLGAMSSAHEYDGVGIDALIPDFRDAATLGILRAQVVALMPGAIEVALARLFSATMPCTHSVVWRDNRGVTVRQMQFALTWDERWPVEALVACLEAAKEIRL